MASSPAAASSLTRPRVAVALISALATVSLGFYYYSQYKHFRLQDVDASVDGPGLHRSNALRRPRRASQRQDSSDESEPQPQVPTQTQGDENAVQLPTDAEPEFPDDWYSNPGNAPRPRTGENIVTLLFRVSEDNARRNAYVHRGCQCNSCGMVPIRGIRYRCANCPDFDLCEVCEAQGQHNKTHIFYKVKVPAPPFGPRHVQPAWYPGDPDNAFRASLPRQLLTRWASETGFERVELDAFWEQWTFMANTEWRDDPNGLCLAMDRKTFERCLVPSGGYRHATPNLIHDRMFAFYDTNHDDLIGFEEFLHGVSYRKRKDKLHRTFDGYDIDGDGYVSRRDFLRMFRAYYVLYKQMHGDILEGLDDQMMTTAETQQLINSRQPLSSLFGREGRVPPADHGRPMEGKIFRSNGDVDVNDGKGVVNEDKSDTAGREEILSGLLARQSNQSMFTESFGSSSTRRPYGLAGDSAYLSGVLNPPRNTVDLASLMSGDLAQLDDILDTFRIEGQNQGFLAEEPDTDSSDEDDQSTGDDQDTNDAEEDEPAETTAETAMEQLAEPPIPDARRFADTLPVEPPLRPQQPSPAAGLPRLNLDKRKRILARKALYERWKRRQFYLDEEEGSMPPQGWDDSQDVLSSLNGIPESSKSAPFLSSRSRSSSKVRFAEDTDDFETRSNPSTSSRSVPERWGGMEIPDAERDAGKEILYQVTQQAYNELLDEIFKKKEDLAIRAAETKEQREKYRELLNEVQLDDDDDDDEDDDKSVKRSPVRHQRQQPQDKPPVANQTLDELLSASGYTVSPSPGQNGIQPTEPEPSRTDQEEQDEPEKKAMIDEADRLEYRDPTMPQFMPDRLSQEPQAQATTDGVNDHATTDTVAGEAGLQPGSADISRPNSPDHIPHATLRTWKRLDLAEEEAKERGGWGRLSYEEFEDIYQEHEFQDSSRNRLDYLGSWIDFCIP
ncbi:EF-hand [Xylariomycetidae sp. FL0641]|nr:EF-hand [Xylariomycetidae sp. FL0641]